MIRDARQESVLKVRVVSKAKNEYLARLVDKFGSVSAAASAVGVGQPAFSTWLNFKCQLRVAGKWSGAGNSERAKKKMAVIARLEELTGVSIRDIFPHLTNDELKRLSERREQTQSIKLNRLTSAMATKYLTYTPEQNDVELDRPALLKKLSESLAVLTTRERLAVRLLYGVDGFEQCHLTDVAEALDVTKERVRQIVAKALRKMNNSNCGLEQFV